MLFLPTTPLINSNPGCCVTPDESNLFRGKRAKMVIRPAAQGGPGIIQCICVAPDLEFGALTSCQYTIYIIFCVRLENKASTTSNASPPPSLTHALRFASLAQAFIPVAQGALSHGALYVIRPALGLAASRVLNALATTAAPTVLRNVRRLCRALVQVSVAGF